jgi:hypothetical protein
VMLADRERRGVENPLAALRTAEVYFHPHRAREGTPTRWAEGEVG